MKIWNQSLRAICSTRGTEPVILNFYGAQESIPMNEFCQPMCLAGRYDNPIPTRFLAPLTV
jgi:hypothetical protein